MKWVMDMPPEEFEIFLSSRLDEREKYISDPETYHYFASMFFQELDHFIDKNYSWWKGRLKALEDKKKEYIEGRTLAQRLSKQKVKKEINSELESALKVNLHFDNNEIRAKYFEDFSKQRKRFFLYNGKFYTYSAHSLDSYPIDLFQYDSEDIEELLNVYHSLAKRSLIRFILNKLLPFRKKVTSYVWKFPTLVE